MIECGIAIVVSVVLSILIFLLYLTYKFFFTRPEFEDEDLFLDLWKENNDEPRQ